MIAYSDVISACREYILDDAEILNGEDGEYAHSDEELTEWIKQAAIELLKFKKHLLVSAEGVPVGHTAIIKDTGVEVPEIYKGALMHGAMMFAFSEDQQRSSFERGMFNAQLGLRG